VNVLQPPISCKNSSAAACSSPHSKSVEQSSGDVGSASSQEVDTAPPLPGNSVASNEMYVVETETVMSEVKTVMSEVETGMSEVKTVISDVEPVMSEVEPVISEVEGVMSELEAVLSQVEIAPLAGASNEMSDVESAPLAGSAVVSNDNDKLIMVEDKAKDRSSVDDSRVDVPDMDEVSDDTNQVIKYYFMIRIFEVIKCSFMTIFGVIKCYFMII